MRQHDVPKYSKVGVCCGFPRTGRQLGVNEQPRGSTEGRLGCTLPSQAPGDSKAVLPWTRGCLRLDSHHPPGPQCHRKALGSKETLRACSVIAPGPENAQAPVGAPVAPLFQKHGAACVGRALPTDTRWPKVSSITSWYSVRCVVSSSPHSSLLKSTATSRKVTGSCNVTFVRSAEGSGSHQENKRKSCWDIPTDPRWAFLL